MPQFFMPFTEPEKQEQAYQELSGSVGGGSREPAERIYSMTWKTDGVTWTATVGEELRGTETKKIGRGRAATYRDVPHHTSDTVMAIFDGVPFLIVHDNKSRVWNMPIMAGSPSRVVRFG
ncbi:hypothetical protein ASF09_04020 [Sphingomonas sp. Leaf242]|nr:hypothetical protein ASF09_04020 [Sphingomonas sp. Leaf242]